MNFSLYTIIIFALLFQGKHEVIQKELKQLGFQPNNDKFAQFVSKFSADFKLLKKEKIIPTEHLAKAIKLKKYVTNEKDKKKKLALSSEEALEKKRWIFLIVLFKVVKFVIKWIYQNIIKR